MSDYVGLSVWWSPTAGLLRLVEGELRGPLGVLAELPADAVRFVPEVAGRCGDSPEMTLGRRSVCSLPAGHTGWHADRPGSAEWGPTQACAAMSDSWTPEKEAASKQLADALTAFRALDDTSTTIDHERATFLLREAAYAHDVARGIPAVLDEVQVLPAPALVVNPGDRVLIALVEQPDADEIVRAHMLLQRRFPDVEFGIVGGVAGLAVFPVPKAEVVVKAPDARSVAEQVIAHTYGYSR